MFMEIVELMINKKEVEESIRKLESDNEWEEFLGEIYTKILTKINFLNLKYVIEIAPRI